MGFRCDVRVSVEGVVWMATLLVRCQYHGNDVESESCIAVTERRTWRQRQLDKRTKSDQPYPAPWQWTSNRTKDVELTARVPHNTGGTEVFERYHFNPTLACLEDRQRIRRTSHPTRNITRPARQEETPPSNLFTMLTKLLEIKQLSYRHAPTSQHDFV